MFEPGKAILLREGRDVAFIANGETVGVLDLDLDLPLIGTVPLASAIGFDTGVYLVVFGGAMLILSMMGTIRPSRTRIRGP